MKLTLKDAAKYVRTTKAPKAFFSFLLILKRVFTFTQERSNRLSRYVAITRAYRNGQSVRGIQAKYGCSLNTINRYARMAELDKRPKHLPAEIRKAVLADYSHSEMQVVEIAKLHNVSPAYVSKIAREEGISRYPPRPKLKRRIK